MEKVDRVRFKKVLLLEVQRKQNEQKHKKVTIIQLNAIKMNFGIKRVE